MNVYIREMKAHKKALIIWSVAMLLFMISGIGKYNTFSASGQSMNSVVAAMPKSLQALLGMQDFDLSKLSGYYGMLMAYILLMAGIHAAMLGGTIISKEERDKTTEFLMTKPISRKKIITAKLMAALTNVVIFNVVTLISSLAILNKYNSKGEPITRYVAMLMVAMFIFQLIFLSTGASISAVIKKPKTANTITSSITVVTYLIAVITSIASNIKLLNVFTPFKYFDASQLMYGSGFNIPYVILSLLIIVIATITTYVFYNKRDLGV